MKSGFQVFNNDSSSQYCSKIVTTNQAGIHDNLDNLVQKHIKTDYQKPYREHNLEAFELFKNKLNPLVIKALYWILAVAQR